MKYLFTLSIIILSLGASAQDKKTTLMKVILTDSIINKYMVTHGGVDTSVYKLFHKSGDYLLNNGIVEFKERNCHNSNNIYDQYGVIRKINIKKRRATVKIHFSSNNNTRVILKKEAKNWRVQSRLIYRSWRYPKKQPRLIYYNFDS
jgi:hypothetical protein